MEKNTASSSSTQVAIKGDYITLGQLLKFQHIVSMGGEEKSYLVSTKVLVNGLVENRRGRKLRPGDEVSLPSGSYSIVAGK